MERYAISSNYVVVGQCKYLEIEQQNSKAWECCKVMPLICIVFSTIATWEIHQPQRLFKLVWLYCCCVTAMPQSCFGHRYMWRAMVQLHCLLECFLQQESTKQNLQLQQVKHWQSFLFWAKFHHLVKINGFCGFPSQKRKIKNHQIFVSGSEQYRRMLSLF